MASRPSNGSSRSDDNEGSNTDSTQSLAATNMQAMEAERERVSDTQRSTAAEAEASDFGDGADGGADTSGGEEQTQSGDSQQTTGGRSARFRDAVRGARTKASEVASGVGARGQRLKDRIADRARDAAASATTVSREAIRQRDPDPQGSTASATDTGPTGGEEPSRRAIQRREPTPSQPMDVADGQVGAGQAEADDAIGEASGPNAEQIASLETEFGVNLGEDSVTEFGTLTGRGQQKLAAAQLDERFPGVDIDVGDVELQDDGTGFKLTPGASREVELARASATLGVDLEVSDVVGGQSGIELTEDAKLDVAAEQFDAQTEIDISAADVEPIEGGFALRPETARDLVPFFNPEADTISSIRDPTPAREIVSTGLERTTTESVIPARPIVGPRRFAREQQERNPSRQRPASESEQKFFDTTLGDFGKGPIAPGFTVADLAEVGAEATVTTVAGEETTEAAGEAQREKVPEGLADEPATRLPQIAANAAINRPGETAAALAPFAIAEPTPVGEGVVATLGAIAAGGLLLDAALKTPAQPNELEVPEEDAQQFTDELATEEQRPQSELPVQESKFDQPELLVGDRPIGRGANVMEPELEIPESTLREQSEIELPLEAQQLLEPEVEQERRSRERTGGREQVIPDELLPNDEMTIGREETPGGFGRTVFPGGSQIMEQRQIMTEDGPLVLPAELSRTVESTELESELPAPEETATPLGGRDTTPPPQVVGLDDFQKLILTDPTFATDTKAAQRSEVRQETRLRAIQETTVREAALPRTRADLMAQTEAALTPETDTRVEFGEGPGQGVGTGLEFGFDEQQQEPEFATEFVSELALELETLKPLQQDTTRRRRRGPFKEFEKQFEFQVADIGELEAVEQQALEEFEE